MPAELSLHAVWLKPAFTVVCLALLWSWETLFPFFERRRGRLRHGGHNLAIALFNTVVLALLFGVVTVIVAQWAARNDLGLLHQIEMPWPIRLLSAVLLLDAWLYLWHRLNHAVPLLWRFHRMHHADNEMDVTTATRFHLGEHIGASVLRLGLIPLLGIEVLHLLVYETLVVGITMFHHANISLGRWDAPLRWLIVTPFMHKVHHSRRRPETDSNYSTLFSFWDRLFRSFRTRADCSTIELGLDGFDDPRWQTFGGMLKTPFLDAPSRSGPRGEGPRAGDSEGDAIVEEIPQSRK
ncbi:MAG: sterol desaturase family protein [Planctomycetaceae bacterium]